MPTGFALNLERLLAPISAEQPTGTSVHGVLEPDQYDAVSRIKMRYYRNAKDWQERYEQSCLRGAPRPVPKENESWQTVVDQATTCITTKSKDLYATAYLISGLTYLHGFSGLDQGLRFLLELLQRYGPQLHPAPQPLSELRKTVPDIAHALKFAPLTDEANGPRCRLDFIIAADISTFTPEQLEPYRSLGTPLSNQLLAELSTESVAEHLLKVAADIKSCEASLDYLDQQIRAQFPNLPNLDDYPNYESVRKELRACHGVIEPHLTSPAESGQDQLSPTNEQPFGGGDVQQSRQKALGQLEEIAAFFERIEPLSPLPFVIRRAVAWGKMSLPQVLAELLSVEERNRLKERAGIPVHIENPPS
jgi:type VI secretion system ImpA family protein